MEERQRYAIGQQDFAALRESGAVYVDKTLFIERLALSASHYYFLARPRRFGKSLFLSTLEYFFQGRRDLFKGLYADSINWNWEKFPVLHLDLNIERYSSSGSLDDLLEDRLGEWEREFGISQAKSKSVTIRFKNVIEAAYSKSGRGVVILVDEYDKPLVSTLDNPSDFEEYREKLAAFYSTFKSCAKYIRLVFTTGVSRFSKLSVFSGLNNLRDITFSKEYSAICGITSEELLGNFGSGIRELSKEYEATFEETVEMLRSAYDGYHFSEKGSDIYNPWSVLNCLNEKSIGNYWNHTGVPTIIAKNIRKIGVDLEKLFDNTICTIDELKGMDIQNLNSISLLYQTGYLTIKDYDIHSQIAVLGVPNNEVRSGLVNVLIPYYVNLRQQKEASVIASLVNDLKVGNPDGFMKSLQSYFAGITYKLKMDNENNFHNAFFLLTNLIGLNSQAEFSTSDGSIDMLIQTPRYVYVIELKYDGSAEEAIRQIDRKDYALQFSASDRKVFKIGANFSSKTRRISDWKIS